MGVAQQWEDTRKPTLFIKRVGREGAFLQAASEREVAENEKVLGGVCF